jgi:hypothetical protein
LGHAGEHQFCLAHLIRDAQYAIDHGDMIFAPDFKALRIKLGGPDRGKIDQYLEAARDVERRIQRAEAQGDHDLLPRRIAMLRRCFRR